MGNSSLRPSLAADATVNFQADLPKFILQSKIGNGKLMKTYLMRCESNSVVVKVYMSYPDEDIRIFAAELTRIWYTLSPSKFPNLLPYQLWMKSSSRQPKSTLLPIYLIRQYLYSNLHDRISTRPFLNDVEKHWLIFQLFKCLETCHDLQIMHGDIKPENVLCTTSNWIVLTDFTAFKPINIPDDNPSDYHYFFDTMGRPRCYLAPERFCNQSLLVKWRGLTSGVSSDRIGSQSVQQPLNAVSSKQNSATTATSSSTSSLLSSEKNTDNALMSDSVFGDAATAIRFQGTDSDKHTAKVVAVSEQEKGKEKEISDVVENDSFLSKPYPSLTASMDVFSLGCTIAEIILDGEPLLDLPGMLRYANRNSSNIGLPGDKKAGITSLISTSAYACAWAHLDLPGSPAKGALERMGTKVGDLQLKEVVVHMTQRDPGKRRSVMEYRQQLENKGSSNAPFPPYFNTALYPLFLRLHWEGTGPDQRIGILCECYGDLTESITGVRDDTGHSILQDALRESSSSSYGQHTGVDLETNNHQRGTAKAEDKGFDVEPALLKLSTAELLDRCHRFIAEAESRFQGCHMKCKEEDSDSTTGRQISPDKNALGTTDDTDAVRRFKSELEKGKIIKIESHGMSNGYFHDESSSRSDERLNKTLKANGSGLVVLVQVVTSVFRHLSLPCSKIASVMLLVRLGMKSHDDELALKRVLPCLLLAMSDPSSSVRALAVRAVTAILSSVRSISPFESNIFSQYLFAPISVIAKDVEISVRIAFAECLGSLAENARRFLEKAHLIAMAQAVADAAATSSGDTGSKFQSSSHSRGDTLHVDAPVSSPLSGVSVMSSCVSLDKVHVEFPYDAKLKVLHDQVIRWIREVSNPPTVMGMVGPHLHSVGKSAESVSKATLSSFNGGSLVKRALLEDIGRLCIFFGQEATTDLLLTQVLTFLNDQDWELRLTFCQKIPAVCAFLGSTVTSECILPFLENALVDQEERVVAQSARCITTLVQLQLLSRLMTVDAVERAAPLLLHPRPTIRQAALSLVEAAADALGPIDATVFLLPLLRPALAYTLSGVGLTAESLAQALMDPLSWKAYRRSLSDRLNILISAASSDESLGLDRSHAKHTEEEEVGSGTVKREMGKKSSQQTEVSMADSWIVSSSPVGINGDGSSGEDRTETLVHRSKDKDNQWAAPSSVEGEVGITQDSPHYPSKNQTTMTVPFEDAAEPTKLQYMEGYVDLVAREMLSRATQGQGRGQVAPSMLRLPEGSDSDVIKRRAEFLSQRLLLVPQTPSLAATGLSEGLTHSLLVPHQQYANVITPVVHTTVISIPPALVPMVISSPTSPSFIAETDREAASKILTLPSSTIIVDGGGLSKSSVLGIFGVQVSESHRSDISYNTSKYIRNRGALSQGSSSRASLLAAESCQSRGQQHLIAEIDKGMSLVAASSSSLTADLDSKAQDVVKDVHEGDPVNSTSGAVYGDKNILNCEDLGTMFVINRLRALNVPPLPPDLGSLQHANGKAYSSYLETSDPRTATETYRLPGSAPSSFVPRKPLAFETISSSQPPPLTLLCVLREHTAAVKRLAVSPDQSYFASGSLDGCVKIWQLKGLDKAAFPRSSITYAGHAGGVTDLCVIENSHSVASASVDGQVHIWRVELACSTSKRRSKDSKEVGTGTAGILPSNAPAVGQPITQGSGLSVRALSVVRTLDQEDGCVTALQHFTADMASIVAFTTQKGAVVGWDLRAASETFRYSIRPEFGVPTCLVVPPSSYTKGWIIVGTSTGYVLMWDTRYDVMTAAWRHSSNGPIHQISYLQSHSALEGRGGNMWSAIPSSGLEGDDDDVYDTLDIDGGDNVGHRESFPRKDESQLRDGGEYLIIAAGCNEVSVWTLPIPKGGESIRCFRAVPVAQSRDSGRGNDAPRLIAVTLPSHPHAPVRQAINNLLASPPCSSTCDPSIGAVLAGHREGSSPYLISGGSDGQIRHWDWAYPSRCCVLAGLSPAQHRPAIVSVHGPHSPRAFDPMVGDDEAFEEYVDRDRESQRDKIDRRRKNVNASCSSSEPSMFICYDTGPPSSYRDTASMLQAQLPLRDSKGTTHSPAVSESSILDLKTLDVAKKMLVSCTSDGLIKLWR